MTHYPCPHLLVETIGRRRLAAGMRQRQVPGIDSTQISTWETGRATPSLANLERYAAVFGLQLSLRRLPR